MYVGLGDLILMRLLFIYIFMRFCCSPLRFINVYLSILIYLCIYIEYLPSGTAPRPGRISFLGILKCSLTFGRSMATAMSLYVSQIYVV